MPARILIVERERVVAEELASSLEDLYEITGKVSSAEEAVRIAGESGADLVLMDIKIEGSTDGIDAADKIRSRFDIPVVYMTSPVERDFFERGAGTGLYGYIQKPFSPMELRKTIEMVLFKHDAERRARESEERLRSTWESLHDLVVVLNEDGVFVDFHHPPGFGGLPITPEQFLGRHFRDALPGDVADLLEEAVESVRRTGSVHQVEYSIPVAGEQKWFNAKLSERKNLSGGFGGVTIVCQDVTAGKRAEERLLLEKKRFESLAENSPFGLVVIGNDDAFEYVNPKFKEMFGYDGSEIPNGREWFRKAFPDPTYRKQVIAGWIDDLKRCGKGRRSSRVYSVRCKDGTEKTVQFRPVQLVTGGHLMTCEDITERKRAEEALRESEEKYRRLFHGSNDAIFMHDLEGNVLDANRRVQDLLGYSEDEILGLKISDLHPKEALPICFRQFDKISREGHVRFEVDFVRKDGEIFVAEVSSSLFELSGKKIVQGIVRDITKRKKVLKALRDSEERYRVLAEHTSVGIWQVDREGFTMFVNPVMCSMLEIESAEELTGRTYHSFFTRESLETIERETKRRQNGGSSLYEVEIVGKHGRRRSVVVSGAPLFSSDGPLESTIGTFLDITPVRIAEEELRESQAKYRSIVDSFQGFLFIISSDYSIEFMNESLIKRTGRNALGEKCYKVLHDQDHICPWCEADGAILGDIVQWDFLNPKDNRWYSVVNSPITHGDDTVSVACMLQDITDRKKAEELHFQTERLKAVADLAAGVSHNFNNLLQIVVGGIHLSLSNLESGNFSEIKPTLEEVLDSCRFGAETVKRLQDFARSVSSDRPEDGNVFDLSRTVEHSLEMSKPWWKTIPEERGIRISMNRDLPRDCFVKGMESQLFEVVVNLIKNAAEALPDGGEIGVRTGLKDQSVFLEVHDTGVGIPKENLSRIFEPFFTTKGFEGTGMGLASSYGIILRHGGEICVESREGEGTTFTVRLPLARGTGEDEKAAIQEFPQKLRILAIDDVEPLVTMLKAGLEQYDQTVLTCFSGEQGIEMFIQNPVDLVICDLGMPGMNGWEVGRRIKEICEERDIRKPHFIVLTGWGDLEAEEKILHCGVDAVVQKPVDVLDLLAVIREVVEKEQPCPPT